jgi:hypothetical protein
VGCYSGPREVLKGFWPGRTGRKTVHHRDTEAQRHRKREKEKKRKEGKEESTILKAFLCVSVVFGL